MGYTPVILISPLPGAPKLRPGASASGGCLQPSLPKGAQGRSGARSLRRQAVAAVARRKNGPWNPQVGKKTSSDWIVSCSKAIVPHLPGEGC